MEMASSPTIPIPGSAFASLSHNLQYLCVPPFGFSPPGYPWSWIPVQPQSPPAYYSPPAGQFYGMNSSSPSYQSRSYSIYPPLPETTMSMTVMSGSSMETRGYSYASPIPATTVSMTFMSGTSIETREYSYPQRPGASNRNSNGSYNLNASFENLRMNDTRNGYNASYYAERCCQSAVIGGGGITVAGRREYEFIAGQRNMPASAATFFQRTGSEVAVSGAFGPIGNPRRRTVSNQPRRFCRFCKSNKETKDFYESHVLRDRNGIQCPVLRNYVCPVCNATGDNAHTLAYCPENRDELGRIRIGSGWLPKAKRAIARRVRYYSE
ncbi:Nanos 2 [Orchesella cincta]|uniref:Nanos 2 n=1 Tax=Orchesella cincta TaxID=48709 RepID=A0A1D2MFP0_ORCCI|nr:Nanos 2 [Orchesella cincta]